MKKTHYLILLILVFSLFVLLISCGKVDEPQENPNPIEDGGETEMVTIKFRVNGAVYDTKTIAKGSQVTPPETNPTP